MSYAPQPHVSAAIRHLRIGVTAAAVGVALALVTQVLVWCFAYYTDARVTRLERRDATVREAVVVKAPADAAPGAKPAPPASAGVAKEPASTTDPNIVPTSSDVLLRHASGTAQTIGVLGALLLVILMLQAVAVAGGGNIPGVEMAVTATTWALVLAALALPWRSVMPGFVFPGVFAPYDEVAAIADAARSGSAAAPGWFGMHGRFVLLPLLMLAGLAAVVLRFRAGVEAGIIATSVSQLDEKLEREIRAMKLGQIAAPRAVGALNQAIGAQPLVDPATGAVVMQHPQAMAAMPPMAPSVPPGYVPQAVPQAMPVVPQPAAVAGPAVPPAASNMSGQPVSPPLRRPI